jgi:hypothetical protein
MAETTRQRKFKEFNKAQDKRDYQKELKDRYDTGTTDEDIAVAKQKAAEMANMMKQPAGQGTMGPMQGMKKGGAVKKMAKGGTASSRADGCAVRGKTKA